MVERAELRCNREDLDGKWVSFPASEILQPQLRGLVHPATERSSDSQNETRSISRGRLHGSWPVGHQEGERCATAVPV